MQSKQQLDESFYSNHLYPLVIEMLGGGASSSRHTRRSLNTRINS